MMTAYRGSSPRGLAAEVLWCGAYRGLAERFTESSWFLRFTNVVLSSNGSHTMAGCWNIQRGRIHAFVEVVGPVTLDSPCKPTPNPKPEIYWRSIRHRGSHPSKYPIIKYFLGTAPAQ